MEALLGVAQVADGRLQRLARGWKRWSAARRRAASLSRFPFLAPAATASIRRVSTRLRARSMCIPRSEVPVSARICVSPAASAGSVPAITSGRPALSTNTRPSSRSGSMPVPLTAWSIIGRKAATRRAVASAPPGLLVNSTWALPETARVVNSSALDVA
jgi:hypothetical protein